MLIQCASTKATSDPEEGEHQYSDPTLVPGILYTYLYAANNSMGSPHFFT